MIVSLIIITILLLIIIAVLLFFRFAPQIGGKATGERLQRMRQSPECKNGQFANVIQTSLDMSAPVLARTMYEIIKGDKSRTPSHTIETIPFDKKHFDQLGNGGTPAICWFGHSSLLLKIHGTVFLTDPVLVGERVSMLSFMGPKRFPYTNYVAIGELPTIDAILLSHDHYDHLDYPTILALKGRVKRFIVPLGVGAHLEKWGIPTGLISEYDWWQELSFNEQIRLTCTPSRHFSGRAITGRNSTLWCSWIISGQEQRVYFGADSGYSPTFKELGTRYGPFDLAIVECGAYSQYWPAIHMMPEETCQAALDLRAKQLMPIHWGKFNLSLHAWREPIQRLQKAATNVKLPLITPRIGQVFELTNTTKFSDWWVDA